ncbi:MAG: L,D-transpeptidase [Pseudolabrys sp.]|jgi:lipoprotein-anchoring transpeptidase ErfK/SrfK
MRQLSMIVGFSVLVGAAPAYAQQYYAQQYAPPVYAQPTYAPPVYAQPVYAQPRAQAAPATPPMVIVAQPQRMQSEMGGGFIEAIFGNNDRRDGYAPLPQQRYGAPAQPYYGSPGPQQQVYASTGPIVGQPRSPQDYPINPIYEKQEVAYSGKEEPGTVVIDTPNKFLYLVEANGRALRYGIGVGRPGFTWAGTHLVSAKKEWPDWTPPKEMLERQPYLPRHMDGGPNNPLGARAMYLGSTLYRIHGSNEPWTIGTNVSSGCIRMRNDDVVDLYDRVKVGAKVVVM